MEAEIGSKINKISKNGYPKSNNNGVPKSNTPTPKNDCKTAVMITTIKISMFSHLDYNIALTLGKLIAYHLDLCVFSIILYFS